MLSIGSQRMKISAKNFKGIEFVQLSQLPEDQRSKILETLNRNFLIKILMDGQILGNCLQYKDYEFWYENIFNTKTSSFNIESRKEEAVAINIAFDN
jgi:hypothetical protein